MRLMIVSLLALPACVYFWANVIGGFNPLIDPVYWILGIPSVIVSFWIGWTFE